MDTARRGQAAGVRGGRPGAVTPGHGQGNAGSVAVTI
jgi:hypothetical protein